MPDLGDSKLSYNKNENGTMDISKRIELVTKRIKPTKERENHSVVGIPGQGEL